MTTRALLLTAALSFTACDPAVDDDDLPIELDFAALDGKTDAAKNYKIVLAPTETIDLVGTQTVGSFDAEVILEQGSGKDWMQLVGPVWRIDGGYETVELRIDQLGSSWGVSDASVSDLAFMVMSRPQGTKDKWTALSVTPTYAQLVAGDQSAVVKTFTRVKLDPRKGKFEATALFEAGEHGFDVDNATLHRARLEYLIVPVPISTWWGVSLEGTWEYKMQVSCDDKPC